MSETKNIVLTFAICFVVLFGFNYFSGIRQAQEIEQDLKIANYFNQDSTPQKFEKILSREDILRQNPRLPFQNKDIKGSINLKGAKIDDLLLVNYKKTTDEKSGFVELLNPLNSENPYYAQILWINEAQKEENSAIEYPNENTLWSLAKDSPLTLTPETPVTLTWSNSIGIVFERTFSMDKLYMLFITDRIFNKSEKNLKIIPFCEIIHAPKNLTSRSSSVHEGGIGYFDNTLKEITFSQLKKGKNIEEKILEGWMGFTDKYWLTSFILKNPYESKVVLNESKGFSHCSITGKTLSLNAHESLEHKNMFFAGAKVLKYLDQYKMQGIKKFDLAVDFGWFYFLTKPLFYVMQFFNNLLGNLALAIVFLTLLSKIISFPMAKSSYKSMARMKEMQPKIEILKQRYGNDKVKVNEEMMRLYKKEKINPVSGCLPMLIQMPIFFCLYKVFSISIEMRHAPLAFWIKDLSAPDPTSLFNLFGLIPWTPPTFLQIGILPLIMGGTMFLQQKLTPQPSDPTQAKMMYLMPLIFLFMFSSFPAGLVLYWTISNILSIIQQLCLHKTKKTT